MNFAIMVVGNNLVRLLLFSAIVLVLMSCSGRRDSIAHGDIRYNVQDVFGHDSDLLELARAAASGDVRNVVRLSGSGAKINAEGKYGITPLWWAAWAENYEGFAALLESGANPNAPRPEGLPVMHVVSQFGDIRFLRAALKYRGDPNARDDKTGDTPLGITVLFNRVEQTDLLINAGADINVQQAVTGWTLPMIAIASNANYQLVYELLEKGANPSLKTSNGKDLADLIRFRQMATNDGRLLWRERVIDYLRKRGIPVERPQQEVQRR